MEKRTKKMGNRTISLFKLLSILGLFRFDFHIMQREMINMSDKYITKLYYNLCEILSDKIVRIN